MQDTREEPVRAGGPASGVVAVSCLVVVLSLQCLRVFFPVVYTYRESLGLTNAAVVGLLVFAAPLLAPLLVRVAGRRWTLVGSAVLLGVLRVTIQSSSTFGVGLAAVAAAAGLVAIGVVVLVARDRGAALVVGLVLGLALDTVVRAAYSTWDVAWHDGALAWSVVAVLVVALVIAAWSVSRDPGDRRNDRALLAGLALGPFLALQVLVLQNPAFISSSGHAALATGAAVVLAGDALAFGAIALVLRHRRSRTISAGATVALALLAWWATSATGTAVVAVVLVGQMLTVLLLAQVLVTSEPTEAKASLLDALGLGVGSLGFGLLVVGYQLHYDKPLPVTNRWLPVVAATLLGVVAVVAHAWPACAQAGHRTRVMVGSAAVAVTVVGAFVFAGLALSEPDLGLGVARSRDLTVMTYNVHETVARDGHLDPDAMARTARQLRPDVLVVQEAGRGWPLSGGLDLAEWAKRRLGMPYVWVPAADHQFGNVVFSRVPVRSAEIVDLPHADGTMKRSAIVARVGPVDGETVTVIGAHLQNGEADDRVQARIDEMHTILRAADEGRHTMIVGDLNSDPASPELQVLLDANYVTTQPTGHCTLKTSNQNCVDWILVSRDLVETKVRAIATDTYDHRPLVTTVHPSR